MSKHKYVSSGTYGCVIKPAIPCKGKPIQNDKVSKIFDFPSTGSTNKAYEDEKEFNEGILHLIDPYQKFTIQSIDACPLPKISEETRNVLIHNCANFKIFKELEVLQQMPFPQQEKIVKDLLQKYEKESHKLTQLIYPYGGDDLGNYKKDPTVSFEELFLAMEDLITIGLYRLEISDIIHQDIKPANLLYNPAKKKVYLIDFGIYSTLEDLYDLSSDTYYCGYAYDYYPPEYNLYDARVSGSAIIASTVYKNFKGFAHRIRTNLRAYTIPSELIDLIDYYQSDTITSAKSLINRYKNLFVPGLKRELKQQYSKINIYMLGISILEVLLYKGANNLVQTQNPAYIQELVAFIKGMINFDPVKRYSVAQTIAHYMRIKQLLQQKKKTITRTKTAPNTTRSPKVYNLRNRTVVVPPTPDQAKFQTTPPSSLRSKK